jgi:integrase
MASARAPVTRELWGRTAKAGGGELLFTAERGGRIVPSNLMSRVLKPAAVRAGLGEWVRVPGRRQPRAESWVGFHTLRHTCATALFRSGWNAVQVQKFLGHSDPGFTLRVYVHLLPEDLPDVPFGPAEVGNTRATSAAEDGRDAVAGSEGGFRVFAGEASEGAREAERAAPNS